MNRNTPFVKGHTLSRGEKNARWTGDKVGYGGLHDWVSVRLGQPRECENCGTLEAKKYEWANLSGEYKRDLTDWARLCTSCHRMIDDHGRKVWVTRKKNLKALGGE